MSDFKAKMHQIRFRLGLCPRPLAAFKGPTSKGREGWRAGRELAALQPCITDLRRIQNTEYNESFWLETLARRERPLPSLKYKLHISSIFVSLLFAPSSDCYCGRKLAYRYHLCPSTMDEQ